MNDMSGLDAMRYLDSIGVADVSILAPFSEEYLVFSFAPMVSCSAVQVFTVHLCVFLEYIPLVLVSVVVDYEKMFFLHFIFKIAPKCCIV